MSAEPTAISLPTSPNWRAELRLRFERQGSRTVLAHRHHVGPLVIQRPFYPEGDVCHAYIVHPPGGVAGGDELQLHVTFEKGSHAVITTPAATKFYRTLQERSATLQQRLIVNGATLEWLPQETITFRDSHACMSTEVKLDRESKFIGWELMCYGRPASNELFDLGYVHQQFAVWLDDQPLLLDRLHLDGSSKAMKSKWGLDGNTVLGTLLAYPANADDLEAVRQQESEQRIACTLIDGLLLCRLIGSDGHEAKKAFIRLWQILRPRLLKREAVLPRIWAT